MCPAGSGPYKLWTKVVGALGLTNKIHVKNIDYKMLPDAIKIKEVDAVLVYGRVNSVMSFVPSGSDEPAYRDSPDRGRIENDRTKISNLVKALCLYLPGKNVFSRYRCGKGRED